MFNDQVVDLLADELVGRAQALGVVTEAVELAREGRGRCVAVVGEPGVGKSRLVRAALEVASARGLTSYVGRAVPGDVPLGPLVAAFVACGRGAAFPATPGLDAVRPVLGHVVPDWAQPTSAPLAPERVAPLLAEALVRLTSAIAPEGAVIAVEDLHVADPETFTVLDHLSDALTHARLTLLVTLRPGSHRSDSWLAGTQARRAASVVELEPLAAPAVAELVASCLGGSPPESVVDFVVEHSDGLPLLVEDLLAALVANGAVGREDDGWVVLRPLRVGVPRTFAESVEQRLRALSPPAVRVIRAATVLGRRFDWRVVSEMVDLPGEEVLDHLRAAIRQLLVTTDVGTGDDFGFRHALTREVVAASLLPPERMRLAARAAEIIDRGSDDDEALRQAAILHAESGFPGKAAERFLELGTRSFARGALDAATEALGRGRSLSTESAVRDQIDRALIEVHAASGRVDQTVEVGEALLQRCGDAVAPGVYLCLARAAAVAGRLEQATRYLEAIPPAGPERVGAAILRASVAVSRRRPTEAEQLAQSALDLAREQKDSEATCEALQVLGRAVRLRSPADAQSWFDRSRQLAVDGGLPLWEVRALLELGTIDLIETGRTDRLEAARRVARSLGAYDTVGHVELHLGVLLAHRGDYGAAEEMFRSVLTTGRTLRLQALDRIARAQLGYCLALAGRADDAEDCIVALADADPVDDARRIVTGLAGPFARLLREDRHGALVRVDQSLRATSDPSWPQRGLRALLHAVEGDDRPAVELESAMPPAERGRLQHAYLLFALAVVRGRAGDARAAEAAVTEGHRQLGWQVAHRRFCLRQLGEAALRDGWGEPVVWLSEALEEFREVAPVASACRRLIREGGGTVPRVGRGDSQVPPALRAIGVTSREMDVLKLVARGRSNQEIATRLHLSRRTVEGHVASMLAKTGAADRAALTRLVNPVKTPP